VAETSGLLNRRTGNSRTEGSNPSVSASAGLDERIARASPSAAIYAEKKKIDFRKKRGEYDAYLRILSARTMIIISGGGRATACVVVVTEPVDHASAEHPGNAVTFEIGSTATTRVQCSPPGG
jgi:hypothetical protein